jgi:hypothetical protein
MMEKCQAIEMCLSLKDEYLAMPLALNHDQGPFWTKVLDEKLERNVAAKIKNWKALKECVDYWCQLRRTLLREGRLPAVSQGQPELDTLVDSWNKVFARRFCQMHKGYFENGDWATTGNRNQSDGVSNSTPDNQRKRPRLDSGISSDVSPRIGSREEASRPQQTQLSPLRYEYTWSEANVAY